MKNDNLKKLILAAMFLAIAFVIPFITAQNPDLGNLFLPMHIPVLLCGLICGWYYGLTVGMLAPILRSCIFGMPVLLPKGLIMACELGVYGLVIGLVYTAFKNQGILKVYLSLLCAMLAGRIAKALVQFAVFGFSKEMLIAFVYGAFLEAIPGIIIQLILIPAIMVMLDKTKLVPFIRKGV